MHKFNPENAQRLERPERYELLTPHATLQRLGVAAGMTVADLGAGTGFFSRAAAELVGPAGRVYAIDMSPEMLDVLRGIGTPPHLQPVLAGEYQVPLPAGVADLVFIAFVTHETPDIRRFLAEAARLTAAGGSIVIVEWKKQIEDRGPDVNERLDERDLLSQVATAYTVRDRGSLNSSHYYVVLQPGNCNDPFVP